MDGQAIAAAAIAAAALRQLPTEMEGPRPAGTPGAGPGTEARRVVTVRGPKAARPTRP